MAIVYRSVAAGSGGGNVPRGQTVLPINDVQLWMACANVKDSSYTMLSEILADTTLLTKLINSINACQYLTRSVDWVDIICADENAMQIIGANDTCLNLLLSDKTWLNGIMQSPYMEEILTPLIPIMTSNTTPSGVANQNNYYNTNMAYNALDNNKSTAWSTYYVVPAWISYDFGTSVTATLFGICPANAAGCIKQYRIQGSNDGTNWDDLYLDIIDSSTISYTVHKFANDFSYRYFRVYIDSSYLNWTGVSIFQLYGKV